MTPYSSWRGDRSGLLKVTKWIDGKGKIRSDFDLELSLSCYVTPEIYCLCERVGSRKRTFILGFQYYK